MKYKMVVFDRDGTLNIREEGGYVLSKSQLKFPPDIQCLQSLSVNMIAIVTNQACVEKGLVSHEEVIAITSLISQFFSNKTRLRIFMCPHIESSECLCRKPKPFLILKAIEHFGISKSEVVFVGDSKTDEEAALNAGIDFLAVCWDSECWYGNCLHTLKEVTEFLNEGNLEL